MPLRLGTPMPELDGATEWVNGEAKTAEFMGNPTLAHFWAKSGPICHENIMMSDMTVDTMPVTETDYETVFVGFLAEIKQHEATLDQYYADIAQIWKEARKIGAKTDSILDETERRLNAMRRR